MALPLAALAAVQAAPAIIGMFQKTKKSPQERMMESNLTQATDLSNLMMNPNDPRYKSLVENESQGIQQNFLSTLRDLIEANRRQALMGRQQIFDPERRDESMFSAITKGKQQAHQQANDNVLNRIRQSIMGLYSAQGGLGKLADIENQRRAGRRQDVLGGLSAGSKLMGMPNFQNLFSGGAQ
jgi:hypothetical protein